MSFREIVSFETKDGEELSIGHEGHEGEYLAVMDGFLGLELVIRFTDIEFTGRQLEFKYNHYVDRPALTTVSIECSGPEYLGEVGEFLQRIREARDDHRTPPMEA